MALNSRYRQVQLSTANKGWRFIWSVAYFILFRYSPRPFHGYRRCLLRLFGAKLGKAVHIYPNAQIWAPWNLEMGDSSTLADGVKCYNVDRVQLGSCTTVSQDSYLCTASHDYEDPSILDTPVMPLLTAPILLGDRVWITSDVFVGPGVTIGNGTVVTARASVFKDLPAWSIASGNPAKVIKQRILRKTSDSFHD